VSAPVPPVDGVPREEICARLDRVRAEAAGRGLRGVLVVARVAFERPGNVAYLSNYFPPFSTGL
jgi:hypothetical protein